MRLSIVVYTAVEWAFGKPPSEDRSGVYVLICQIESVPTTGVDAFSTGFLMEMAKFDAEVEGAMEW